MGWRRICTLVSHSQSNVYQRHRDHMSWSFGLLVNIFFHLFGIKGKKEITKLWGKSIQIYSWWEVCIDSFSPVSNFFSHGIYPRRRRQLSLGERRKVMRIVPVSDVFSLRSHGHQNRKASETKQRQSTWQRNGKNIKHCAPFHPLSWFPHGFL